MNIISFLIACAAALTFLLAYLNVPSRRPLLALGLLLLTVAWVVALVWQTPHNVILH